jgi:hypothetical protein
MLAGIEEGEGRSMNCEALCEVLATEGAWDEAASTVATARAIAEQSGSLSLPFFADRLEGRVATVGGEDKQAAMLLRRSADGFAGLGAIWEEAWSRLLLAEVAHDPAEAAAALAVFERLGSVDEVERAQSQLAAR